MLEHMTPYGMKTSLAISELNLRNVGTSPLYRAVVQKERAEEAAAQLRKIWQAISYAHVTKEAAAVEVTLISDLV